MLTACSTDRPVPRGVEHLALRANAKLEALVRACRRLEDLVFEAAARPRRPWWWWVAFGFYASAVVTALWVMYRTVAGHPILGGLLARLGG